MSNLGRKKQPKRISLSDMLNADDQRILAARRFMFQTWIDDVVNGRAA